MSYVRERDEFIIKANREGIDINTSRKLLRYASTLQRLAVAQCNGDYPFNGDRDRPNAIESTCATCSGTGYIQHGSALDRPMLTEKCTTCRGNGKTWARDPVADTRHDKRYTVCPKCETSGVSKSAMRKSSEEFFAPCADDGRSKLIARWVCPDCRTQELVTITLKGWAGTIKPVTGGDPRGAVLRLSTPNYPYTDNGSNGAYGLYVPARER